MASLDILFHTLRNDLSHISGGRILFMNARYHDDLLALSSHAVDFYQPFKPSADALEQAGFDTRNNLASGAGDYNIVLIDVPQNILHMRYLIARALRLLRPDGLLVCAGDNNAGGKRLASIFKDFGLSVDLSVSRDKARCVVARNIEVEEEAVEEALSAGGVQRVLGGDFVSQPGVFGWDKVDPGSKILTDFIPSGLSGAGADFGCGYGYLSRFVLSECAGVKQFSCIDADYHALKLCEKNLYSLDQSVSYMWEDLTHLQSELQHLDFVIMNPPFHMGKKTDISIGKSFIDTASSVLKKSGRLFMVSNVHLPYEDVLASQFDRVIKHHEGRGFKVHEAIK